MHYYCSRVKIILQEKYDSLTDISLKSLKGCWDQSSICSHGIFFWDVSSGQSFFRADFPELSRILVSRPSETTREHRDLREHFSPRNWRYIVVISERVVNGGCLGLSISPALVSVSNRLSVSHSRCSLVDTSDPGSELSYDPIVCLFVRFAIYDSFRSSFPARNSDRKYTKYNYLSANAKKNYHRAAN